MARQCTICGRGPQIKISRSKSMVATRKIQRPNLQTKKIAGKRQLVCAKCLKTMAKKQRVN